MTDDLPKLLRTLADAEERLGNLKREYDEYAVEVQRLREEVFRAMTPAPLLIEHAAPAAAKEPEPASSKPRRHRPLPDPRYEEIKERFLQAIVKAGPGGILNAELRPLLPPDMKTRRGPIMAALQSAKLIQKVGRDKWAPAPVEQ